MKTRDKIIHAAIELFNEQGEQNVTTNHIAAHLGMSPGNLYYHFRNKEDIIQAIISLYAQDLHHHFGPEQVGPVTLQVSMGHLDHIIYVMWRYRFLYNNLPDILARDPALRELYRKLQAPIYGFMQRHMESLREQQILLVNAEELQNLVHIMKQILLFWIAYMHTLQGNEAVTKPKIYEVIPRVLFLFRPYIAPAHQAELAELEGYFQARINNGE